MSAVLEAVNDRLNQKTRSKVVRAAIDACQDNPDLRVSKLFARGVEGSISIKGFRSPWSAPPQALAREVSRRMQTVATMTYDVVVLWAFTRPKLHEVVFRCVRNAGVPTELLQVPAELSKTDVLKAIRERVEDAKKVLPDVAEDDLWLVSAAVMYMDFARGTSLGRAHDDVDEAADVEALSPDNGDDDVAEAEGVSTADDSGEDGIAPFEEPVERASDDSPEELQSKLFNDWLSQLNELDSCSRDWQEADLFAQRVSLLSHEKILEAERVRLVEPALDLARMLRDKHSVTLAEFGITLRSELELRDEDIAVVAASVEELAELESLLGDYAGLLATATPGTVKERQERRQQEVDLETSIGEKLRSLPSALLSGVDIDVDADSFEADPELGDSGPAAPGADPIAAPAAEQSPESESSGGAIVSEPVNQPADPSAAAAIEPAEAEAPPVESEETVPEEPAEQGERVAPLGEATEGSSGESSDGAELVGAIACASCDLADSLEDHEDLASWSQFVLALASEGDAPGAYWVARALEYEGKDVVPDSALLAAHQGSRWLSTDSPIAWDLGAIVGGSEFPSDDASQLLALTAALKAVLVEPRAGTAAWLQHGSAVASRFGLLDLTNAVRRYADQCALAIRPEYLAGIADDEAREEAIGAARDEVRGWMERAQLLQAGYQRATAVWRRLISKNGDLAVLIAPVLADRRSEAGRVREAAANWRDAEFVDRRVAELVDDMYGGGADEIEAHAAVWLRRRADETSVKALRWCDLVGNGAADAKSTAWIAERIEQLRGAVEEWLRDVPSLSEELCGAGTAFSALASTCVRGLAVELGALLQLNLPEGMPTSASETELAWWISDGDSLEQMLARRLLWCPGLDLTSACVPNESAFLQMADAVRDGVRTKRSLRDATVMWCKDERDFRFLDRYLIGGLSPLAEDEHFAADMRRLQEEAVAELRDTANQAAEKLEQSVVDNILDEVEKAGYDAQLIKVVAPLAGDGSSADAYAVGQHLKTLTSLIGEVGARRESRLGDLADRWTPVRKRLVHAYEGLEADSVVEFVERAFSDRDIVLLNECVPMLELTVDQGAPLEPERFVAPKKEDVLRAFNERRETIRAWARTRQGLKGVLADVEARHHQGGIRFRSLSEPMHREVLRNVVAWGQLKRAKGSRDEAIAQLPTLVQYLGFELIHGGASAVSVKASKADWLHAVVSMTAGDRARPIPLYGSKSQDRYDVVCLWERPGMVSLGSRIQELKIKNRPVIVFYLGHLSDEQRLGLVKNSRSRNMPAAVLDETLFLFLSRCRDVRLPDFLECAIPYASLNPYTPGVAGNVPPEMYFGREQMADELENQHGSCLVYGGRQLGKSALLRRVAARFDRPDVEQYADVHEIKLVGDRLAGEEATGIWRHLHEVMSGMGLIDRKYKSPEDLIPRVREVMDAVPERRVIILFDEADNFLHDDSRSNYSQLSRLKALMEDTDRRFKMVFAGLQEVQRFRQLPNHPLAHLGEPILVGALEPEVARKLVRGPIDVLGFRMSNEVVLRILSYTNYHPGLLQLFCSALVERVQKRPFTELPPYDIRLEDVETVFRQDLRKEIRKRFDWTLELDARYQAIVWSMIVNQLERADGYSQAYTASQIMSLASSWWAAGFEGVHGDSMSALLTELCGLNILVSETGSSGSGPYRLRSPNLVRLMGTGSDLEMKLLELGERPAAEMPADLNAISLWIDGPEGEGFFSPLTRAQDALVGKAVNGVSIVHGSEALGLARAEAAVRALIPRDLPSGEYAVARVPDTASSGEGVRRWLREFGRRHREQSRLIAWTTVGERQASILSEVVEAAAAYCRSRQHEERQWLRVIIFMDPHATVAWFAAGRHARRELESQANVVTWLRPLTAAGIAQRLNRLDMMSTAEICESLMDATAGWTNLVEQSIREAASDGAPSEAAAALADALETRGEPWSRFEPAVGLDAIASWDGLLRRLSGWLPEAEREVSTLTPEDVDWPHWTGEDTIEMLKRLSVVRHAGQGRVALDDVVKRFVEQ